jgi:hypothetical protein
MHVTIQIQYMVRSTFNVRTRAHPERQHVQNRKNLPKSLFDMLRILLLITVMRICQQAPQSSILSL